MKAQAQGPGRRAERWRGAQLVAPPHPDEHPHTPAPFLAHARTHAPSLYRTRTARWRRRQLFHITRDSISISSFLRKSQTPQNVNPHGRVDEVLIDSRALQTTEHYVIQCSVLQTNYYKLSHAMRGKSYENIGKQTVSSCTTNTGTFQIVSSEHVQYTNNSNNACLTFHILYVAIVV